MWNRWLQRINESGTELITPQTTRLGYTFSGWLPSVPETVPDSDTTYSAQWTANTYTVSYNGNGNTGGITESSMHTYGALDKLTSNGFIKTGYHFLGWATSPSGTVVYTDNQSVSNLAQNKVQLLFFMHNGQLIHIQ
jgi:hypothetical protein